jgi:hypothetical protein
VTLSSEQTSSPSVPQVLGEVLSDARVQDCLWIGLMEWDLRIEDVALRPRLCVEGGVHPDGWALRVGLGPGVRLEAFADSEGRHVTKVSLVVTPSRAPELLRRSRRMPVKGGRGRHRG